MLILIYWFHSLHKQRESDTLIVQAYTIFSILMKLSYRASVIYILIHTAPRQMHEAEKHYQAPLIYVRLLMLIIFAEY